MYSQVCHGMRLKEPLHNSVVLHVTLVPCLDKYILWYRLEGKEMLTPATLTPISSKNNVGKEKLR